MMNKLKEFVLANPLERAITTYIFIFVITALGWVEWKYWTVPAFTPLLMYAIVEIVRPTKYFSEQEDK